MISDEEIDAIFDRQYKQFGQVCDRLDMRMFARACIEASQAAVAQASAAVVPNKIVDLAKDALNAAYHHGRAHLTVREDHAHSFANARRDELLTALATPPAAPQGVAAPAAESRPVAEERKHG
jgi:histone H3/H4